MCDLIDLDNSTANSLDSKLASPLIPLPSNTEKKNISRPNKNTLITGKRESIGDNPFDALLNEAIENVSKKEDPFEIVYEKSLVKSDVTVTKENNVNITDDLKVTQLSWKLKENKNSDEYLANPDNVVPTIEVNSLDLSILSYSEMNDDLCESNCNEEEETDITNMLQHRIPSSNKQNEGDINNLLPVNIKSIHTRSHSQGDINECKQLLRSRSNSLTETLRSDKRSINDSDTKSSSIFNKGFVEDTSNDISGFSTMSNMSSTTRHSWLLPAFEDDIVDNLITVPDLNATIREGKNNDILFCNSNTNDKTKSQINVKEAMDVSPLNQITVNKKSASTLLVDLKKIVKKENDSEVNRLLEDLEKVLGIHSSNIELSSSYFQTINDSKATENTGKHDTKDRVDDVKTYKIEVKESHCDNKINEYKVVDDNNELLIKKNEVSNDLSSMNPRIEISPKKESSINTEKQEINVDINNCIHNNVIKNKEENNRTENNEKVAVELLINLGKVLSGQSNESATLNLLKNLGEVLNLVSKNDQEKNKQDSNQPSNTEKKSIKNKSENKEQSATLLKVKKRRSLDLLSKTKPSYQKVFRKSMCATSTSPKKLQKSFVSKENNQSQLIKAKKRFPSDPGSINLNSSKQEIAVSIGDHPIISIDKVNTNKNKSKENPSIKLVVKNQLKQKSKPAIVNKKGPMKAIIPIGNMQRKGTTTPPKSPKNIPSCIKIFSSTPNSMENSSEFNKSPKLKPMASSTPDFPKCKYTVQLPMIQRPERLNVSCDISPINVQEEVNTEKSKVYLTVSPRRVNKCPSPRKRTPKSQKRESSIPKYSVSPGIHVRTPSKNINKSQEISMSSQNLSRKEENIFKKSPTISKKIEKSEQKSPLKDSNKNITKRKPFNLSSKFRGNNNEIIEREKENTF